MGNVVLGMMLGAVITMGALIAALGKQEHALEATAQAATMEQAAKRLEIATQSLVKANRTIDHVFEEMDAKARDGMGCTTDSECAALFGGSGDPEPLAQYLQRMNH